MSQAPGAPRRRYAHPVRAALLGALLLEILVTLAVIQWIGFWPTVALLVALSGLGAWLVRREGSRAWAALANASQSGRMPTGELGDAAMVVVGGTLLLVPGFVTGLVGLCFVLKPTRPLTRGLLARALGRHLLGSIRVFPAGPGPLGGGPGSGPLGGPGGGTDVVQGEVIRDDSPEDSGDDEAGRTS